MVSRHMLKYLPRRHTVQ